jgi:membrane associated rhomboid family serine protease
VTVFRGASPFDNLTPGVRGLIFANVGVYICQSVFPSAINYYFALLPLKVIHDFWVWQIFTYAFLHGGFWHLFFNMFALWMFAPHIESYWGTRTFLKYYALCVVGAALTQVIVAPSSVVVGASGGIYGLLLAFGLLFPDSVIFLFFVFPLRAIQATLVITIMTLMSALQAGGDRIAYLAHLGGLATGFLYFKLPVWWETLRSKVGQRRPVRFEVVEPESRQDSLAKEVDRILEKISKQGVGSLTEKEHETMRQYSRSKV